MYTKTTVIILICLSDSAVYRIIAVLRRYYVMHFANKNPVSQKKNMILGFQRT